MSGSSIPLVSVKSFLDRPKTMSSLSKSPNTQQATNDIEHRTTSSVGQASSSPSAAESFKRQSKPLDRISSPPSLKQQSKSVSYPASSDRLVTGADLKLSGVPADNRLEKNNFAETTLNYELPTSSTSRVDSGIQSSTVLSNSSFPTTDLIVEYNEDSEWTTVIELLGSVRQQLAGLRSFIRRLRSDNEAVYREIFKTAMRLNGKTASTMVPRCEDTDNDDDDGEFDDEGEVLTSEPPARLLQQLKKGDESKDGGVIGVRQRHDCECQKLFRY